MKLLIAEDELLAREGISQLIPPVFTEVRAAGNGLDALEIAKEMKLGEEAVKSRLHRGRNAVRRLLAKPTDH